MASYGFDAASTRRNRFCIAGYDTVAPFASFLPGIAGPLGIPLWAFYVNRGQAIASFGVQSKDAAIMEFLPANRAYQSVPLTGFRTFIKRLDAGSTLYEPFSAVTRSGAERRMFIEASELELEEANPEAGLQVNVVYFTLPGEPFAGLVRQASVKNIGSAPASLELLDGLPALVPFGINDGQLKLIGRTVEAWMAVYHLESGIPYFRVQATIGDEAEVAKIEAGHFYLPLVQHVGVSGDGPVVAEQPAIIVDPSVIFGNNTSLTYPARFVLHSLAELQAARQITVCRTPCAFTGAAARLAPGESLVMSAIIGHVAGHAVIEAERKRLAQPAYFAARRAEAQELTKQLTDPIATSSADPRFDAYCRQTLLDNTLRGGWPVQLDGVQGQGTIYHLYGRRHGDLERDYNAFNVPAEFYSQGNAAYRDINQNRRCDVLLNPAVGDAEVLDLLGLVQPDGYNPLVVLGGRFTVPPERQAPLLKFVDRPAALCALLARPFTPGSLLRAMQDEGLALSGAAGDFVAAVLAQADRQFAADHGEGYWVDHWYYNLDLIQSYLAVYPDRLDELLFERTVSYYDSRWSVQPRERKYVLAENGVRQYGAVALDTEHARLIESRDEWSGAVRDGDGRGEVFRSTVFEKLFGIALLKFTTLDPAGMGIEMEAGKPGWCDALNGLPGIFGSAMPATYELLRWLDFLLGALDEQRSAFRLPVELAGLLRAVEAALAGYRAAAPSDRDFRCWDTLAEARETYRARVRLGFDGRTEGLSCAAAADVLHAMREKVADGIRRAEAVGGDLPATYFFFEVTDYAAILGADGEPVRDDHGRPYVRVRAFEQHALPPFLEGAVHALRAATDVAAARTLYERVKASALYDCKLGMYKTNASLATCSHEIGRLRAFTPGWLENESVFLHMAYKYLVEVLRSGLHEEFFAEMRSGLAPFLDPAVYGRSTLENSSFIVSSAHPDETLHGRGFVARLTGACAEFLSLWTHMMAGPQPFFVKNGQLCLRLRPTLPPWLFRTDGSPGGGALEFTFLGQCSVTYRRTAGVTGDAKVTGGRLYLPDGGAVTLRSDVISEPYASMIRSGEIRRLELDLA